MGPQRAAEPNVAEPGARPGDLDRRLDPLDPEQQFLYVPDGTNNKVWALDRATLEPVYSWGTGGRQPGQFDWLHYMAFDSQGNLYTGEVQTGHRVQKFVRLSGN